MIVLSGQSNAEGVGHVRYLEKRFPAAKAQEYWNGYDNIRMNYYSNDKKSEGFVATTVNCTETAQDTFGPELGMADYLNDQALAEEVVIVKFAMGGASLKRDYLSPSSGGYYNVEDFEKEYAGFLDAYFGQKPIKAGWCYNGLVHLLRDSIDSLKENGFDPQIAGFCWMQGESDAFCLDDVNHYKGYFDNFIRDFKKEFSPYLENCVFVNAGISDVWNCYQEMNAFKKEYAARHPDFVYLDTIAQGLTTRKEPEEAPDIAHYDCESVIRLGQLFAEKVMDRQDA